MTALPYGFAVADLLDRFDEPKLIGITDDPAAPAGAIDEEKVAQAASDAAGELESYAAKYYAVPLAPFPSWLRTQFLDLWAWRLLFNCKPDWLETEQPDRGFSWSDRRKELLRWLTGLSSKNRETLLPGCGELTTPASTSAGAWSRGGTNLMTREGLLKL